MIAGFRSDLSITCMIDGNFGRVSAGSRVSTKTSVNKKLTSSESLPDREKKSQGHSLRLF